MDKVDEAPRSTRPLRGRSAPRWLLFGGGKFQLAFTIWLLEQLPGPSSHNRCILVRPTNSGRYDDLEESTGKFRCTLRGIKKGKPYQQSWLLDKIDDIVYPWEDFPAYLRTAQQRSIRYVVSNTTEAGLTAPPEAFAPNRPAQSFPGKLTQWLFHRFQHFGGIPEAGITLLPLELVADNGPLLKSQILHYVHRWALGDAFARWVTDHCPAYATLVDRIVTGTCTTTGSDAPLRTICAEPHFLWAIESPTSLFPAPEALVIFSPSLGPIRNAKVRLLNATHTAMVAVGLPRGFQTVREILTSPEWGPWFGALLSEELYPSLAEVDQPGEQYVLELLDRLANPFVEHRLHDISLNSLAKVRVRLWPAILDYQQKFGQLPARLMQALQSLISAYRAADFSPQDDPEAIAALRSHDPQTPQGLLRLLNDGQVWGAPLPVPEGMFPKGAGDYSK